MPNLTPIRTAIKAVVETVNEIGPCYTRVVHANDWKKVLEFFKEKNKKAYFGAMLRVVNRLENPDEDREITRTWELWAFRQVNDTLGTQITFEDALEDLAEAFANKEDDNLNGLICEVSALQVKDISFQYLGGVLCHWAVCEFTTSENYS